MQTLVQVVCSRGKSLRDAIVKDSALSDFALVVIKEQDPNRPHGWAKLKSTANDRRGALNIEWDSDTRIMLCRVVNRGAGRPHLIIGDFVDFLLRRFRNRITSIHIFPR